MQKLFLIIPIRLESRTKIFFSTQPSTLSMKKIMFSSLSVKHGSNHTLLLFNFLKEVSYFIEVKKTVKE